MTRPLMTVFDCARFQPPGSQDDMLLSACAIRTSNFNEPAFTIIWFSERGTPLIVPFIPRG
jgi:hypothetical protein